MSDEETTTASTEASSAESAVASMASESTTETTTTETTTTTGRPDNVPEKFWNTETNSINADAAVKSYTELESKFGSFTGAPDEYVFNSSEEMTAKLTEAGVEINTEDDPLYQAAMDMAKETGMSQDGFDKLSNLYIMTQLGNAQADADYKVSQLQELGDRADQRLANINAWGEKNLDAQLLESLQSSLTTAAMVPILEHMIASTRNAAVSATEAAPAAAIDPAKLTEMQFAKDDNGNRRINTDPAFKAEYQKLMNAHYGETEHRTMVG